jgi:hypothetical protein
VYRANAGPHYIGNMRADAKSRVPVSRAYHAQRSRAKDDARRAPRVGCRAVSGYPTRPHKWGQQVIKSYPLDELKALLEAADRGLCPQCKREASEPCPCFETEKREHVSTTKKETTN